MDDWALATVADLEERTRLRPLAGAAKAPVAARRRRASPSATRRLLGRSAPCARCSAPGAAVEQPGDRVPCAGPRDRHLESSSRVSVLVVALGVTAIVLSLRVASRRRATSRSSPTSRRPMSGNTVHFSWEDPGLDRQRPLPDPDRRAAPRASSARRGSSSTPRPGEHVCITVTVNRDGKTGDPSAEKCVDVPRWVSSHDRQWLGRPPLARRHGDERSGDRCRRRDARDRLDRLHRAEARPGRRQRSGSATTARRSIGRANPQVLELNTVVRSTGTELSVVQSGDDGAAGRPHRRDGLDRRSGHLRRPARASRCRPSSREVFLAGTRVVIYAAGTGELWIAAAERAAELRRHGARDPEPRRRRGRQVAPDGTLVAYSPELGAGVPGRCDRVGPGRPALDGEARRRHPTTCRSPRSAISGRCSTPTTRKLAVDGRTVDVSSGIVVERLDRAASAAGRGRDARAARHRRRALGVPFDGGGADARCSTASRERAARPPCSTAASTRAWTSGTAWRHCAGDPAAGIDA